MTKDENKKYLHTKDMQTNTGKAFRCLYYRLGSVLVLELEESPLSCSGYQSDLLLIFQSGPILSCNHPRRPRGS